MRASVVEDFAAFQGLRAEWDALAARSPTADLFSSFDWLEAFWRAFSRPGESLAIVTVRRADGRLVAALPLIACSEVPARAHLGPIARLPGAGRLLGARRLRSLFNFFSGRSDVLVDPGEPEALGSLLDHLRASPKTWDVVELAWLPEDSPLYLHLAHAPIPELSALAVRATESPYVDLRASSYDAFYAGRFSAKTRSRDRGHLRDALRGRGSLLEVLEPREDVGRVVEELLGVEDRGWKGEAKSSMRADPAVAAFVHDVCARFAKRGELAVVRLRVEGTLAAFVLGFVHRGVFSYYKTSFDPRLSAIRPGRIVTNRALEHAFALGLRRFDFLGAPDEYKLRYTDQARPHATVLLHHRGARSRVARSLKRTLLPAMKRILGRPELYPVRIDRRGGPR